MGFRLKKSKYQSSAQSALMGMPFDRQVCSTEAFTSWPLAFDCQSLPAAAHTPKTHGLGRV